MSKIKLNKFLEEKVAKALEQAVSDEYKSYILKEAEMLSQLGIENESSLKKFHHISQFVPGLVRRATGAKNVTQLYSYVGQKVFENRESINSLSDLSVFVIDSLAELELDGFRKLAYPTGNSNMDPIPTFNIAKWTRALNDIYMKNRLFGNNKEQNFIEITSGWSDMEKNKFKDWVKFYESGAHLLYKKANSSAAIIPGYNSSENGSFYPFKLEKINGFPSQGLPTANTNLEEIANETVAPKSSKKTKAMEESGDEARKTLIRRLRTLQNSLLKSHVKSFVGEDLYRKLVRTISDLLNDVMEVKTASMLSDLVGRAESILKQSGLNQEARLLVKIAQSAMDAPPMDMPPASPPGEGNENAGRDLIAGLNKIAPPPKKFPTNDELRKDMKKEKEEADPIEPAAESAPVPPAPPAGAPPAPPPSPATASVGPLWAKHVTAEVKQLEHICECIADAAHNARKIKKMAQALAPEASGAQQPKTEPNPAYLDALDQAFANITVNDVIKQMQALSKVFKNREIARQLSIIDLMLDKLGIAGLFPQLAEATKSALESNQYSSIRVDEVLSKLMSMIDQNGNVNVNFNVADNKDSIVDQEMKKALENPEVVPGGQPMPGAMPSPEAPPMAAPEVPQMPPQPMQSAPLGNPSLNPMV